MGRARKNRRKNAWQEIADVGTWVPGIFFINHGGLLTLDKNLIMDHVGIPQPLMSAHPETAILPDSCVMLKIFSLE
jgi:hypothetical protein